LLSNPTASTVAGQITAYGYGGKVRAHQILTVAPLDTVRWSAPASLRGRGLSLSIQVAGKIVVSGISGPLTNAVAQPRDTWYTVAPRASGLVAFNPDATTVAQVDVRYVGSKTVRSEQLKLGGHRSYTFSTHRARTVVVYASHAITVGYANPAVARSPMASAPATRAALTVGGATTQVSVYNPGAQPAHITVSVVGRANSYNTSRAIGHSGVFTLQVRKSGDPPRGVVINSDIPVVSTPSS
jgi:hypothetical protein